MSSSVSVDARTAHRRRLPRPSPFVADSLLVVVLLLLAAYEYTHPGDDGFQAGPNALNVPLTLLELVPLAWRRRAPVITALIGFGAVAVPSIFVAHTQFAYSGSFPLAFYLYTVARHREWRVSRWMLLAPLITNLLYAWHVPGIRDWSDVFFGTLVFGLAFFLGLTLRRQAAQRKALSDALAQLGREQEQRERIAVLDERARLARDLHDVVAHAVALMLVQVGAARWRSTTTSRRRGRGSCTSSRPAGRPRATSGACWVCCGPPRTPNVLAPAPGSPDWTALQDQMVRAGLDVELEIVGEPPALSPSLELSAYRVVQEALTNVLKHAGPTTVRVRLDYTDASSEGLRIEVVDEGPRGAHPPRPAAATGWSGCRNGSPCSVVG